jgi:hypothetical protein
MVPAVLMPLVATSQVAPTRGAASADREAPSYKYQAYAGYGYTSLNQVNGAVSGLQGVELAVTRNWGKYFGLTADGAYYSQPYRSPVVPNSTYKPTVTAVFMGPEIHAPLYGQFNAFVHVLLGGEHVANVQVTPNISFAGGAGGGMEYRFRSFPHLALRAAGDELASSFSVTGNTPELGYSPHRTKGSRATFGVAYSF